LGKNEGWGFVISFHFEVLGLKMKKFLFAGYALPLRGKGGFF